MSTPSTPKTEQETLIGDFEIFAKGHEQSPPAAPGLLEPTDPILNLVIN
jgi:hypothetical protein